MTAALARLPLRVRLTLAFAGASAVLLAAVGTFVFFQVKHGLDASLDASLRRQARAYAQLDRPALRRAFAVAGEPAQLLDGAGRVALATPQARGAPLLRPGEARRTGFYERDERLRLASRRLPGGGAIVVGTSMVQRERALEELSSVLLIGGPLILLLSSGAGYLVAAGALRPVERMRRRASGISAATPDARLPLPPTRDELRRLGETLNAMLARLEEAARHERAFLSTASHELRTPLAILKTEVEVALHEDAGEAELRAALRSVGEEADRLIRLAEDLLTIARGEDGALPLDRGPVPVDELAAAVAARYRHLAPDAVTSRVAEGSVVLGDRARLEQAVGNLVDNALAHGRPPVELVAVRHDDRVELHVTDAGRGFGPGPAGGGFGLGLAIAGSIAGAHGGDVGVTSTERGADVWLSLPAAGP